MKYLSLSEKIIFLVNTFVAFIFLFSLLIPFIPPRIFSFLSVIGLFTPILITLNFVFIFFWIYKLKKHFLLSLFVLVIGHSTVQNFINFSNNSVFATEDKISVLSYNVRLFNLYNWIDNSEIENQINPSFTRTIIEDEKGQVYVAGGGFFGRIFDTTRRTAPLVKLQFGVNRCSRLGGVQKSRGPGFEGPLWGLGGEFKAWLREA